MLNGKIQVFEFNGFIGIKYPEGSNKTLIETIKGTNHYVLPVSDCEFQTYSEAVERLNNLRSKKSDVERARFDKIVIFIKHKEEFHFFDIGVMFQSFDISNKIPKSSKKVLRVDDAFKDYVNEKYDKRLADSMKFYRNNFQNG